MVNERVLPIYIYKIHGLNIKSEIVIRELVEVNKSECIESDVTISYGMVPREIEEAIIKEEYIKLSKRELYFYIKNTAHYYVADGSRIIVEPETQSDMEEVKIFLLGTCLGILLNQRNTIAIHGGAVAINGQGIVITGHTGAGKSTLTATLRKQGVPFLSDDVSALGNDINGNCIVYPAYPQQKLCSDAMERMGYDTSKYAVADASRDKYAIPLEKNFLGFPILLNSIFEINVGETSNVEIIEIFGNEKIKSILKNIYRIEIIRYLGLEAQYFNKCIEIAKTASFFRIMRPKNGFTVDDQIKLIKNTMKKTGVNAV